MTKNAIFSPNRKYRYMLSRIWLPSKGLACFVCLNPSTADEKTDDPTIRRCIQFADSWGYGGIVMVNLFAFRATKPKQLFLEREPIGFENDHYINNESGFARITIAAWGVAGKYQHRDKAVMPLLTDPHYLTLTKDGHPGHPLFLKKDLKPIQRELVAL